MKARPKYETARWFRRLGTCACGKPATGELMSFRNDVLTKCCTRCGERHAKAANDAANAQKAT